MGSIHAVSFYKCLTECIFTAINWNSWDSFAQDLSSRRPFIPLLWNQITLDSGFQTFTHHGGADAWIMANKHLILDNCQYVV